MASAGWSADYTAESGYLPPLVTCGSPLNIAHFCDRGIERQMEEAMRSAGVTVRSPRTTSGRPLSTRSWTLLRLSLSWTGRGWSSCRSD